jgi:hypothetical protein
MGDQRTLRIVALLCAFVLLGLCLPARKLSHHAWVVFPWLGVLCGLSGGPFLEALLSVQRRRKLGERILLAAVLISWSLSLGGLGAKLNARPCVISAEFGKYFDRVPPGADVLVVSREPSWGIVASLAAERDVVAWPLQNLISPNPSTDSRMPSRVALIKTDEMPVDLGRWTKTATARGWTLLEADDIFRE